MHMSGASVSSLRATLTWLRFKFELITQTCKELEEKPLAMATAEEKTRVTSLLHKFKDRDRET